MRFGWLEIILVIVVIIAIAIIARIIRPGRIARRQNEEPERRPKPASSGKTSSFLNRTGIVLIIAGGIALVAAFSFFRFILQSYLWAFLAIAVGVILLRFTRKKRDKP